MDGHKLLWYLDRVERWENGSQIAPLYFDMGITQTCNINCCYCYYATPQNRTKSKIDTDKMVSFLRDCASLGTKAVGILGDGEPMVHNGVYEIVNSGNKFGLDMAISTNGTKLDLDKAEDFLRSLSWIRFNISAATPQTYIKVMGSSEKIFNKVIKNIQHCVDIKNKFNLDVTIGMQMVLIPECLNDIVKFAKLGKDLGVDYSVIKQCSENENSNYSLTVKDYEQNKSKLAEAEQYSDEKYSAIIKWNKIEKFGVRNYDTCYGCEFLPQISGAGEVYCCGNFFGNEDFYIGNINEQSFKDILYSKRYKEVMDKVKNEVDVHKQCGTSCRQNEINEFLYTIKNKKPKHINFI